MVSIVAGGAGFVGANLCKRLIDDGRKVVVIDNFCRGREDYLASINLDASTFRIIEVDLANREECVDAFQQAKEFGCVEEVWHLAANSDIPAGVADSDVDIKDTFLTTSEILRCMEQHSIENLFFASSSAIYGDLGDATLHESIGPILPISNYGAMKLASEALISAACESFLKRACLFRFPNVVGTPATHGVILDFIKKLTADPTVLPVLGDGSQKKAYLHVSDLVDAMLYIARSDVKDKSFPINIGPVDEGVYVRWIAEQVVARVAPSARLEFGEGNKGWVGDVPKFSYSVQKLINLGWTPTMGSMESVLRAIDEIATQEGY